MALRIDFEFFMIPICDVHMYIIKCIINGNGVADFHVVNSGENPVQTLFFKIVSDSSHHRSWVNRFCFFVSFA